MPVAGGVNPERELAAAEARVRFRASLPRDLPGDAALTRVAVINEVPPTLDMEYLVGGRSLLLRQRPAQSEPGFPPEAVTLDVGGVAGRAVRRLDGTGRWLASELYWTKDGMDYALVGAFSEAELVQVARGVVRPGAA